MRMASGYFSLCRPLRSKFYRWKWSHNIPFLGEMSTGVTGGITIQEGMKWRAQER
jgi:hypothetical protein